MKPEKARFGYSRLLLLAVALLLPAASLIPLGSFWLWQQGYVVHWAIASLFAVAAVFYLERRLIVPLTQPGVVEPAEPAAADWSPRQMEAWQDVLRVASEVGAERIVSRDAALNLALQSIEIVARRLHPERRDPLLQFTVPEALAVMERSSANLRRFVLGSLPFGDRITVAQLMWLYRWRGVVSAAEKGYELWRLLRLLNPAAAVTNELRERFSRRLYEAGREQLGRRLAQALVKEVGRAAIDLYGGNLRLGSGELQDHVTAASRRDLTGIESREAEPIRILMAGQTSVGKSSLVNALAGAAAAAVDVLPTTTAFLAYRLSRDDAPTALVIDSPGLSGAGNLAGVVSAADECDIILWVSTVTRAAREVDREALAAIRSHFASLPSRRQPPIVLVVTHVDRLRPFNEWAPPYNLAGGTGKAQSIREAAEACADELGFAATDVVPVRADEGGPPYNVEALWAKIIALLPEARRARTLRTLSDAQQQSSIWRMLWSQATGAGRAIRGTFRNQDRIT